MTTVQIVGATGYGGLGMTELMLRHPHLRITSLLAKQDVGRRISDVYPHLRGFCDMPVEDATDDSVGQDADLVVFATPDGVGQSTPRRARPEHCRARRQQRHERGRDEHRETRSIRHDDHDAPWDAAAGR